MQGDARWPEPSDGSFNAPDQLFAEEYLQWARIAIKVLGFIILEPLAHESSKHTNTKSNNGKSRKQGVSKNCYTNNAGSATILAVDDGCILLRGSTISPKVNPTCPNHIKNMRKK